MAYLARNFCRSDGCRPFGKFGWDPTITGSLSSFFFVNSCCARFLQCCCSLAFTSESPRGFILLILPSPLLPLMTTTINTYSLLVQYLPTISPFGIDGNTCIQRSDFNTPLHSDHSDSPLHLANQSRICSRNISNSTPFSPFDINVKEETFFSLNLLQNILPLSSISV
jgi:hypothetical protein